MSVFGNSKIKIIFKLKIYFYFVKIEYLIVLYN